MTRLSHPAPGREITSPFGWRIHPLTGRRRLHRGVDFGGSFRVQVAGAGTVLTNGFQPDRVYGYGYYVIIQHPDGIRTLYAHGKSRSKLEVGQRVRTGDTVFTSGSTGASTGNHLHFEVRKSTFGIYRAVDPAPYLTAPKPPSPPLSATTDRKRRTWLG